MYYMFIYILILNMPVTIQNTQWFKQYDQNCALLMCNICMCVIIVIMCVIIVSVVVIVTKQQ